MLSSITAGAQRFQQRLTRLDNQPLSKAALVVIIFLDLFVFSTIINGLYNHTRQWESPDGVITPLCREIVIDDYWNPPNRLSRLANKVSRHRVYDYPTDQRNDAMTRHALCGSIISAYQAMLNDTALVDQLVKIPRLDRQMRDLRAAQERVKSAYDTNLLEQIAEQPQPDKNLSAIRKESSDQSVALDNVIKERSALAALIEQNSLVQALYARIDAITEADRLALQKELQSLNFWYPVKRFGIEALFLLPLLGVFYFWNSRSVSANRPFQTLVSSHLLVVASIPVVLKIGELVWDIIPKKLLKKLIEFLESLKLVAIWDYLVIAAAIIAALLLIYVLQKKLFSHDRLMQRRIAKGLCQECGQHLPPGSRHCPACGAAQFRACPQCNEPMHAHGKYCMACGHESAEN